MLLLLLFGSIDLERRRDEDLRGGKLRSDAEAEADLTTATPVLLSASPLFEPVDDRVDDRLSPSSSTIISSSSTVTPVIVDVLDLLLINVLPPPPDGQFALLWLSVALYPPVVLLLWLRCELG